MVYRGPFSEMILRRKGLLILYLDHGVTQRWGLGKASVYQEDELFSASALGKALLLVSRANVDHVIRCLPVHRPFFLQCHRTKKKVVVTLSRTLPPISHPASHMPGQPLRIATHHSSQNHNIATPGTLPMTSTKRPALANPTLRIRRHPPSLLHHSLLPYHNVPRVGDRNTYRQLSSLGRWRMQGLKLKGCRAVELG